MQFKNKWKRFWTLSRRHEEGFTLVELIVVIAILAILAGVGTVGYSAYVNKANMVADQTRVAEIVNALQLAYYSEGKCEAGALILTTDYAKIAGETPVRGGNSGVDNEFIDNALAAAFGENWRETLKLSYAKWGEKAQITAYVAQLDLEDAKNIASSNYLTNNTSAEMLGAVTTMTNAATGVLTNYATNGGNTANALNSMLGSDFTSKLGKYVSEGDANYNTAASNMMVVSIADEIEGYMNGENNLSTAGALAVQYASVYAYATATGNTADLENLNTALAGASSAADLDINKWLNTSASDDFKTGYATYTASEEALVDQVAFMHMMGALNTVSGNENSTYTNKENLTNANMFSSATITDHLDSYINAVNVYAGMTDDEIAALKEAEDAVTILISAAGQVSVTPAEAMPD